MQKRKFLASILFVLISGLCFAQNGGSGQGQGQGNNNGTGWGVGNTPPPPIPPPPPGLPIDGAVPVALVLAAIFGIKKTIDLNK